MSAFLIKFDVLIALVLDISCFFLKSYLFFCWTYGIQGNDTRPCPPDTGAYRWTATLPSKSTARWLGHPVAGSDARGPIPGSTPMSVFVWIPFYIPRCFLYAIWLVLQVKYLLRRAAPSLSATPLFLLTRRHVCSRRCSRRSRRVSRRSRRVSRRSWRLGCCFYKLIKYLIN